MITLAKSAKPLHEMSDQEVRAAIVAWEACADRNNFHPAIANRFNVFADVFVGEQLRRTEAFLRS